MLDSEQIVEEDLTPEEPEEETQETPEEETGELVVIIEGEEAEPDEEAEAEAELGEKGRNALRKLRERVKEANAKARELEAKLAERTPAQDEPELKRPTMEDCGFNEDVFAEKLAEYVSAKAAADAKRKEAEDAEKARDEAYKAKLAEYHEKRAAVGVDDDAQARVVSALNNQQQAALMDAASDPAKVVAALAKHPKALAELAGVKEIHRFTYKLAQLEGKITMTTKAPPPPESKLRGNATGADPISAIPLEKLRKQAEDSGDYTAYLAEKRRRAAAG